jgi:hypothetical protein
MYGRDPKAVAALNMDDGGASLGAKPKEEVAGKRKAAAKDQIATR